MSCNDRQLVARIQEGDKVAFRNLVERYKQRVYSIALGIVRDENDAMDISQEAFIKVYRYIDRFQGSSNFYTWLYRIVVNLCIDHVRKRGKSHQVDYDDAIDHDREVHPASGTIQSAPILNPSQSLEKKELSGHINNAIGALSPKHRNVILLREVEGLSYKEIADVLEISVGTVMSRLHHARQNLQRSLKRQMNQV